MRVLADTHIALWVLENDPRLPNSALRTLRDLASERYVSSVSLWEIAIKVSLGKLKLHSSLANLSDDLASSGFDILPFAGEHALAVAGLPWHHKDPFDRALVAQSAVEPMRLLTADARLGSYGAHVLVAG